MLGTIVVWASIVLFAAVWLACIVTWLYIVYQMIQMFRYRGAGVSWFSMHWPTNALLTDRGQSHRNRAILGYFLFIGLVAVGFLVGWLSSLANTA